MSGDFLVSGGPLWAGPDAYWPQGLVEVRGGDVKYAGPVEGYNPDSDFTGRKLDAAGGLIMPGLINAHCHGPMTLFRGLADDLPLDEWLNAHMFPVEAKYVNEAMTELCALLAAAEMLLSGTTCVQDSYFCMGGAARAYEKAGMRAVAAQGMIDFPAPGVPDPERKFEAARRFVEDWQDRSSLITPALFAHSLYTCSPQTLEGVAALAQELGVDWYTHLSETKGEVDQVRAQYGTTPARHLHELGLLQSLSTAVHGVWLDPGELELLKQFDVCLVHCPESNMKLASGQAGGDAWLRAGLTVGLGTDGAASNNDLDLIGEMGSAARLAKIENLRPEVMPAGLVLDMALDGSARCTGLQGRVGRLKPGYAGDLIVIDLNQPHLTPLYDVPSHLVYAARGADVRHVAVDGRLVVRDRQVLSFDVAEVMTRVNQLARVIKGA